MQYIHTHYTATVKNKTKTSTTACFTLMESSGLHLVLGCRGFSHHMFLM